MNAFNMSKQLIKGQKCIGTCSIVPIHFGPLMHCLDTLKGLMEQYVFVLNVTLHFHLQEELRHVPIVLKQAIKFFIQVNSKKSTFSYLSVHVLPSTSYKRMDL